MGIAIPEHIREALAKTLKDIPGKKVPPENWHLTLQFLLLNDPELKQLKNILSTLNFGPRFSIGLKNLGAFPDVHNAKLLWIGVEQGLPDLTSLANSVTAVLAEEGFKIDTRPFIPHLTIRRYFPPRKVIKIIQKAEFPEYDFLVQEIILYQSILESESSHYIHLGSYPLGN